MEEGGRERERVGKNFHTKIPKWCEKKGLKTGGRRKRKQKDR